MDFLMTALAVTLCMGLFGGGFFAGWKARDAVLRTREPSAKSPGEEEARRTAAEEEAYQKLMGYSVETAYGMNKKEGISA